MILFKKTFVVSAVAAYSALRSHGERQKIRQNSLDKSEAELIYEYRLSRAAILELCYILKEDLQPSIRSPKALTVVEKVLISLKLQPASGSFQSSNKDNLNVAQSTVSEVEMKCCVVLWRFITAKVL